MNQPRSNLSVANLFADSQEAHLEVLKNVVKILYDDKLSYEIIKYIINLKGQPAEEEKMANDFNLKFDTIRQSLLRMGNDGVLSSTEHKKKREPEAEDNYRRGCSLKRSITFEWLINQTFYDNIKQRFEDLKKKLEKELEHMSKDKFQCPKCKVVFELEQVAYIGYVCKKCDDKPKLTEIQAEDVTTLRKRCNELINMISEQFIIADKSGSGFQYMQIPKQVVKEKKTVNNFSNLGKGAQEVNKSQVDLQLQMQLHSQNEIMIANNLEDQEIDEAINVIKKDEYKLKKFKQLVELYYTYK